MTATQLQYITNLIDQRDLTLVTDVTTVHAPASLEYRSQLARMVLEGVEDITQLDSAEADNLIAVLAQAPFKATKA